MYAVGTVDYNRLSLYNKLGRGKLCNQIHILTLYRATDLVTEKHVSSENKKLSGQQNLSLSTHLCTFQVYCPHVQTIYPYTYIYELL